MNGFQWQFLPQHLTVQCKDMYIPSVGGPSVKLNNDMLYQFSCTGPPDYLLDTKLFMDILEWTPHFLKCYARDHADLQQASWVMSLTGNVFILECAAS